MLRKIISSAINQFFSSPPLSDTNINDLPVSAVEKIFSYLTYEEILQVKSVSRYCYNVANSYIRDGMFQLQMNLEKRLEDNYNTIVEESIAAKEKISILKLYNIYKILDSEMKLVCALNRHIFENKGICLPIGSLLDLFFTILKQADQQKDNVTEVYTKYSNDFYNEVKTFLYNMEINDSYIADVIPLGVQTVDLMDLLLDTDYKFTVTYKLLENTCQLRGTYTINRAKLLNYFPQLPNDCNNRQLTEEESRAIMKFLSILLQVHNRLNIEEDFSWLQIEGNLDSWKYGNELKDVILKIPNKYNRKRSYVNREIVDIKKGIIRETYIDDRNEKDDNSSQGLICKVNLTCALMDAPVETKKTYEILKNDILKKHSSVKVISSRLLEYQQILSKEQARDLYSLTLYLKIWYSKKSGKIFPKDTVEFYFNDGNVLNYRPFQ